MKRILSITIFALLLGSCSKDEKENLNLKPLDFKKKINTVTNAILLDVRTPEEVMNGYLKGALNFDFKSPQFSILIEGLDKEKPYLVYCASGVRSGKAADKMREKGFKTVYTLDGGLNAWKGEGLETDVPAGR
jgi:rhodanese-related sulfurtransferase